MYFLETQRLNEKVEDTGNLGNIKNVQILNILTNQLANCNYLNAWRPYEVDYEIVIDNHTRLVPKMQQTVQVTL